MELVQMLVAQGGLGNRLMWVTYCYYGGDQPFKPTHLWSNSDAMYNAFFNVQKRTHTKRCGRKGCGCGDFGKHGKRNREGARGNSHNFNTETYCDAMCIEIVNIMRGEITDRLQIDDAEKLYPCGGSKPAD